MIMGTAVLAHGVGGKGDPSSFLIGEAWPSLAAKCETMYNEQEGGMTVKKKSRNPLCWGLPLLIALPFAAGGAYVIARYLPQAQMLLDIAMKMVVIP